MDRNEAFNLSELYNIEDAKRKNERAGYHFFEPASMRFFDSRVLSEIEPLPNGGCLFVTSERFRGLRSPDGPRLYTIRYMKPTGDIDTIGKFQDDSYAYRSTAIRKMRAFADWLRS